MQNGPLCYNAQNTEPNISKLGQYINIASILNEFINQVCTSFNVSTEYTIAKHGKIVFMIMIKILNQFTPKLENILISQAALFLNLVRCSYIFITGAHKSF